MGCVSPHPEGRGVEDDRALAAPVQKLLDGTRRLSRGELDWHIAIHTADEFGKLAAAFNDMAAQLKISKDEIEEWNRTLEEKVEIKLHQAATGDVKKK